MQLLNANSLQQDVKIIEWKEHKVNTGDVELIFDKANGLLKEVRNAKGMIPLSNGPVVQRELRTFPVFPMHMMQIKTLSLVPLMIRKTALIPYNGSFTGMAGYSLK